METGLFEVEAENRVVRGLKEKRVKGTGNRKCNFFINATISLFTPSQ